MTMADDIEKKGDTKKNVLILQYYNQVGEVNNYYGDAASKDNLAEASADKVKRQELIRTNKVLKLSYAPNDRGLDVLRLFRFIEKHFVDDIIFVYEWVALRRFLERNKLLNDCNNGDFAAHMNQKEWYEHAKAPCKANEMNTYNFLSQSPEKWVTETIPPKSRATVSGLNRLYKVYHELEDNKSELNM